ncbi:WD40 repeat-containing protein [Cavenderia fasciculata]|uniref:tRNA (guanine-N(7)-)-methyltransferase non-catalytic subunit n=1 Tax=Cavenderia fasciculata TaxID=261658 RepID=F4QC20_CACFS|nr:WD40 repeat-containing protein [Cavenderia fasciculata]EGG13507.1 WD40 repeat-containing protein [Cavenderia fasciculata]|eukprot:XP_004350211.1 WD40 repeat-containing protein [Cavenderia fasciculata]
MTTIKKVPISNFASNDQLGLIAYSLNNILRVFNTKTSTFINIDATKQHQEAIKSIEFSKDGTHLITSSNDKTIKVWNTTDLSCINSIDTPKKISSAQLTLDNKSVVIADKAGDVYIYNLDDTKEKLEKDKKDVEDGEEKNLLLGHFSSITDMIFSDCHKYILTADRDEKVRVSKYPHAFDIESFCLGHTQFVSKLLIKNDILLTGSGDGTIKVWKWKDGQLLQSINMFDKIKNEAPEPAAVLTTIPLYISNDRVYVYVEEHSTLFTFKYANNVIDESSFSSIQLESSPLAVQAVDSGNVLLVSLWATTDTTPLVVAIDTAKSVVIPDHSLAKTLNEKTEVPALGDKELKELFDTTLQSQFKKYSGLSERKKIHMENKNKDDQPEAPLKLRKMTTEGAAEVSK